GGAGGGVLAGAAARSAGHGPGAPTRRSASGAEPQASVVRGSPAGGVAHQRPPVDSSAASKMGARSVLGALSGAEPGGLRRGARPNPGREPGISLPPAAATQRGG